MQYISPVQGVKEILAKRDKPALEAPAPVDVPAEAPRLIEVTDKQTAKALDAPLFYSCGSKMQPAGSCYVCSSCGSTSGCS